MRSDKRILGVVDEYCQDPDPQVRRNAAVALGVLDSDESIKRLVEIAVGDHDATVREKASEVIKSSPEKAAAAEQKLQDLLGDDLTFVEVYNLLGQVRRTLGINPLFGFSWRKRMRLAYRERLKLRAGRRRVRWWPIGTGVLGGLIGAVATIIHLSFAQDLDLSTGVTLALIFIGPILGGILAFATAQMIEPATRCMDRLMSLILDHVLIVVSGGVISVVIGGLVAVFQIEPTRRLVIWTVAAVTIVAAIVRLGTILAFGAYPRSSIRLMAAVVSGATMGIAGAGIIWFVSAPTVHDGSSGDINTIALFLLPVAWGLGLTFATIDRKMPPLFPRFGEWFGAAMGVLLLLLAVIVNLNPVERFFSINGKDVIEVAKRGTNPAERKAADKNPQYTEQARLPATFSFNLPERQDFIALVVDGVSPDSSYQVDGSSASASDQQYLDLVLDLYRGQEVIAQQDDPPFIHQELDAGLYRLLISRYGEHTWDPTSGYQCEITTLFPALVQRISPTLFDKRVTDKRIQGSYSMSVWFDPDTTDAIVAEVIRRYTGIYQYLEWVTMAGTIRVGSMVRCSRPIDTDMGPVWIPDMDEYSASSMTVVEIYSSPDFRGEVYFRAQENPYIWDTRWITAVEGVESTD